MFKKIKTLIKKKFSKKQIVENKKVTDIVIENGDNCPICLDPILESEKLNIPCSHTFHITCINKWKKINTTCPICRQEMPLTKREKIFRNLKRAIKFPVHLVLVTVGIFTIPFLIPIILVFVLFRELTCQSVFSNGDEYESDVFDPEFHAENQ